jgi:hypothetical protein
MAPTKFTPEKRAEYLGYLEDGMLKFAAAKRAGIGYRTIQRYRNADPDFKDLESLLMLVALEPIEKVVRDLALQGDLTAAKMILAAHNRSVYGADAKLTVDATDAAVELSRNEAIARVAAAQEEIAKRRAALEEAGDVIEATHTPIG